MPEEQKTAETEQERLADFPRDLSRSFTYLHRQRKKYMDDRLRGYGFVGGMPMILLSHQPPPRHHAGRHRLAYVYRQMHRSTPHKTP